MEEIRLGVIGTNFVSDWLCDNADAAEGIRVQAVYSRTEEKGKAFVEKHGIGEVYTDREAFWKAATDAVYIASPNFLHVPYAEEAIRHGKHVLLEKPATLTAEQFSSLVKLAEENGVILLEAMRPGHDPAMETVRQAMQEIGTIRRAVFDFCQYSSRYDAFRAGTILNAFNPAYGNGALMDIGCYALHVCVMLFGRPKDILSRSVKLHNGVEGMGTVFLDYGDFSAEVVYSKITDSYNPSVIMGEDGHVLLGRLSMLESVHLHRRGGETTTLLDHRFDGCKENNMVYELADFVRLIREGGDASVFHRNTQITLEIMDTIRQQNGIVFPGEESGGN